MKKIKPWASYNPPYENDLETIEVNDVTDEEIDAVVREEIMNYFEWGWTELKDGETE